ncbi:GNAT family N-acetyltransferase [Mesobacillus jeotgali]|uniref:GNAT family N-acetyltransferase n=1 Tax=Mesobacillus jeotgali TaxID=129985 RepID=UPI0017809558|nr:GNAT family N-acetyltransferase [Mesobacillus jeotgali]UYZ21772.1 GNAT family N-acetyltransferase [Mesobacillus jeotgali]
MQRLPLIMAHSLSNIPSYPLPEPYKIRSFKQDEEKWATILTKAGEFDSIDTGLERFRQEFVPYPDAVRQRVFFIEDETGQAIGTASAWFGELNGEEMGRIHWVGIVPEHQGKKLAKPLLTFLLQQLASMYGKAYLKTQTTNLKAINAYLNLGFEPYIKDEREETIWEQVYKELDIMRK